MARTQGQVKRSVLAAIKVRKLYELSRQGASFQEAARAVKMTPGGLRMTLYNSTGSTLWPIVEDEE